MCITCKLAKIHWKNIPNYINPTWPGKNLKPVQVILLFKSGEVIIGIPRTVTWLNQAYDCTAGNLSPLPTSDQAYIFLFITYDCIAPKSQVLHTDQTGSIQIRAQSCLQNSEDLKMKFTFYKSPVETSTILPGILEQHSVCFIM